MVVGMVVGMGLLPACTSAGSNVTVGRATAPSDLTTTFSAPEVSADPNTTNTGSAPSVPASTATTGTLATTGATATTDTSASTATTGQRPRSGVSGVGDVLYPDLGNPGLDVQHYDIDLRFDHSSGEIAATATLTIKATAALADFTLDAVHLAVTKVIVNGSSAAFDIANPELRITPSSPIALGDSFTVAVTYSAHGNDSSISAGTSAGWFETKTGSFVLDEPDGARFWLPSNDHPSDKATYRFSIHVPKGVTAVANGVMVSHTTDPSRSSGELWIWDQPDPMTTYLIQLMTGSLDIVDGVGSNGLPLVNVLQHGDQKLMQPFLDDTAKEIDFFSGYFGPFPLSSYGIAMTDGYIGGAMEEQGRSLFSERDFASGTLDGSTSLLLSHELTHQWFGDAVSPADWQDIWLNESFATYGEWMWLDHAGFQPIDDVARETLARRQNGTHATGTPDIPGLFGYAVYDGGAVVLHALRQTVGDATFFEILRTWVQSNIGTSRTSKDFIALSSRMAGIDLTLFFHDWLYADDLPHAFPG
jgi:aminopeptidase N